ncbi:MAG: UDP-N-acetylmuramoyl-L-alanyl-D-glutamate--2,6-diaminopimelate ligase [Micavibrio sp.]
MRLSQLNSDYHGSFDPEIEGLTEDSRRIEEGWLFAAFAGVKTDGARYVEDAIRQGAVAILSSQENTGTTAHPQVAFLKADNPRQELARMAARFYGIQPQSIVAVTGTNGKTSTAWFAQQIWTSMGIRAASLGTLGLRGVDMAALRNGKMASMTTPDTVSLMANLADLAAAGVQHLAMEASSHGLAQYRLDGVKLKAAAFTNLTRDHLDYHHDMDDYFAAKARLFNEVLPDDGVAVINADISQASALREIAARRRIAVIDYGYQAEVLKVLERRAAAEGQALKLSVYGKVHELVIPLVGEFMMMNALAALGLVIATDESLTDKAVAALAELQGAPGRLQLVMGHPLGAVYVDYAHTPDALENILKALRPHAEGRLVSIVGCGGDRDPGKRPIMGRIAAELSDLAIITDDNPRSEDPAKIRAAMMRGAVGAKEIGGRREAIDWAVKQLSQGDVLVIAGKGHEQGQIMADRVEPFDDVQEAARAIKEFLKDRETGK